GVVVPADPDQQVREALDKLREGTKEGLSSQDHRDLGVAYMNMGLVDDAVREFNAAQAGEATEPPERRVKAPSARPAPAKPGGRKASAGKGAATKSGAKPRSGPKPPKRATGGRAGDAAKATASGKRGAAARAKAARPKVGAPKAKAAKKKGQKASRAGARASARTTARPGRRR
ncbi:MAG: valine--tRNA ligase, partial [Myxococcaceae bacterium]|nr:valine--tRNA ligase [Myxococcaceae bacterium]